MPFVLLDRDGETVAVVDNSVRMMHNFSCARALVYTDTGHYGYMDLQGRLVLPAVYDYAADFADGVALVGRLDADGRMGYAFIDENGEVATLPGTSSRLLGVRYSDGLLNCRELDSGRCVYMDRKGRDALFLSDTIVESFPFRNGRAVVQSEQGRGVIDRQGRSVVASVYTDIYLSGKDRMALCRAGQWQLADAEGNPLSPARYEAVSPFLPSDALVVRKAGRMALLNADGHTAAVGWVDSIACDPVALRLIPQVFVRSEKATSTTWQTFSRIPSSPQQYIDDASRTNRASSLPKIHFATIFPAMVLNGPIVCGEKMTLHPCCVAPKTGTDSASSLIIP